MGGTKSLSIDYLMFTSGSRKVAKSQNKRGNRT
jgi:hypothetical protein